MYGSRGMIKWQGFAAVKEQFQGIQKLYEQQNDVTMPFLDEQRLEEINTVVCDVMAENRKVSIVYHKNQRFVTIIGYIHYFDTFRNELRVMNEKERVIYIKTKSIIDIELG